MASNDRRHRSKSEKAKPTPPKRLTTTPKSSPENPHDPSRAAIAQPFGSISDITQRLHFFAASDARGFARAEYESEYARRAVAESLRDKLTAAGILFHELTLPTGLPPNQLARELLRQLHELSAGVVSLSGFHHAFRSGPDLEADLQVLNFQRENLAAFPLRQIWWMPTRFAERFLQAVPDLNSWFLTRVNLTQVITEPSRSQLPVIAGDQHAIPTEEARIQSQELVRRLHQSLKQDMSESQRRQLMRGAVEALRAGGDYLDADRLEQQLARLIHEHRSDEQPRQPRRHDFFISYSKADRVWAEWMAWVLEAEGFTTAIQAWDFRPGSNFVLDMHQAAAEAERTIAVLSPDYLLSQFTQPEWAAAFIHDPTGRRETLLPVRVKPCDLVGLLSAIVYIDLVDLNEAAATSVLLKGIETGRAKPATKPDPFGTAKTAQKIKDKPRYPGTLPDVWNVPHVQNPNFTGRDKLLKRLRQSLTERNSAALVQALHGLGGIGKTQLAVEYAYRHAGDYECVWWVRAEEPVTRTGDLAALAKALGLPEADAQDQRIAIEAVRKWFGTYSGWLLVLDNVPHPQDLDGLLPQHPLGHILITSRDPNWHERATPLKVDVFERPVSVEFLLQRTSTTRERVVDHSLARRAGNDQPADQLAEELGDLPLALAQAVGYMQQTQLSIAKYLELFRQRHADLWGDEQAPFGHQETVALTFGLSIERLEQTSEVLKTSEVSSVNLAAVDLLNVCAFLAPDDIPRSLFATGGKDLPTRLSAVVTDELTLNRVLKLLRSYSLIELTAESFSVHRLLQAVCRDRLQTSEVSETSEVSAPQRFAAAAVKLINATFPGDVETNLATWPIIQGLLPHAKTSATHAEQLEIEPQATGRLLNEVGVYLQIRAEFAEAKNVFERALHVDEKAFGPDHPTVAIRVNNLGGVLQALGDLPGARQAIERALKIDEKAFGPDHPNVARDVNNLGSVLQDLGDLPGARQAFERALKIDEKAFGPDHPNVAIRVNNLGSVLQALGDLPGARQAFEQALKIDEKAFGPDHPNVARDVNNLGGVLLTLGNLPGARQAFERALGIYRKFLGDEHPRTQNVRHNLEFVEKLLKDERQPPK